MARGNPDNLRAAAARKRQHATERAETALRTLIKRGAPITCRGVAAEAGCSPDFLYNSRTLRPRIEHLRAQQQASPPPRPRPVDDGPATSNVVRALSAQLAALKKRHHDEITALNAALAAAHGELLDLRRRHGGHGRTGHDAEPSA